MQAATDRKREVMEPSDKGKCDVIHGCCVFITEGVHPTLHAIASIQKQSLLYYHPVHSINKYHKETLCNSLVNT